VKPVNKGEGWQTARLRTVISVPMQAIQGYIFDQGYRNLVTLDYGSGRGSDADFLEMDKFDPNWFGDSIISREHRDTSRGYDIITNIYVLNVIQEPKERDQVIQKIRDLLSPDGKAFIAVRDDVKEDTSTQYRVYLDLPLVIDAKGRYRIYEVEK